MKPKYIRMLVVLQFVLLFTSCDSYVYLFIWNGCEFDVVVNTVYSSSNEIRERTDVFLSNEEKMVSYKGFMFDDRIISIRIETLDNVLLAEYSPEYIYSLQKIYKRKRNDDDVWIFTEKGLFLITNEIFEKYNDGDKILAYYRSDEAVQDLQKLLEKK